jgi:hypothetical protein
MGPWYVLCAVFTLFALSALPALSPSPLALVVNGNTKVQEVQKV